MDLEKLTLPLEVADKAFNIGIGAAIAGVTALVGAMGLAVKETFKWADQLDSIQDVIGGTNEEAAALNFTLRKSGVATETFNKSMVIMEKGLVKADGSLDTVGTAMKKWGINVFDANGNLKTQAQLIEEASKQYSSFSTQQEKVNFLTEVFGRGGAEMIDFFDTLGAEGGIDAVTQKVKDFGLAIDPNRYEQFTRNLEELKLVGLGLAVQFTEKLMPAFESLMLWAQGFEGMSFGEILGKLGEDIDLVGLSETFKNWAREVDWAAVSQEIINGIDSIDWAGFGENVRHFSANIWKGISEVATETDWLGIGKSLGLGLDNMLAGMTGQGNAQNVIDTWVNNILMALNISAQLGTIVGGWIITIEEALSRMKKVFFAAFQGAAQQAIIALIGMKTSVMNKVQEFMDAINGIIGKGISMVVSVSVPSLAAFARMASIVRQGMQMIADAMNGGSSSAGAQMGLSGAGLGLGNQGGSVIGGGRASGGFASGQTLVGENGPELVNLPSGSYVNNNLSSSRMANKPVQAYIDYDELARTLARVLGQQVQRA